MLSAVHKVRMMSELTSERETAEERGGATPRQPSWALVLLLGHVRGDRRRFAVGTDAVQLGREPDREPHIQLEGTRASRVHAEITWSEVHRAPWISDLGSRNGVFLNGVRVAREILRLGDIIRIGETVFRITSLDHGVLDDTPLALPFVGTSQSLRRSIDMALRVAGSTAPIMVLGPTGTGKELMAETIHRASRRTGRLVPVSCAALLSHMVEAELFGYDRSAPDNTHTARPRLFRAAEGGTLFLDEVGELALEVQAKLLRVLDATSMRTIGGVAEDQLDVRFVATTNQDLAAEVSAGRFRGDLYARLTESVVQLDPLCERPEDLAPLWHHFVDQLGHGLKLELCGAALEAMALYAWPFNVRELRQLARSTLLAKPQGGELAFEDLPAALREAALKRTRLAEPVAAPAIVDEAEKAPTARQLRQLLEEYHGNVKDVAAFLGKDRKQIYRWLRRGQIDPGAYRH